MRYPIWILMIGALVAAAVVTFVGARFLMPERDLLVQAEFSLGTISPNADFQDDVTEVMYEISRNSQVDLRFADAAGNVYTFREGEPRAPGTYRVLFSGVVDGYVNPDEQIEGEVLRRLMPDGVYTWTLTVTAQDNDDIMTESGTLILVDGDNQLPQMSEFTIAPSVFTPNQDGVDDRVLINIFLQKEAELTVFLEDEAGQRSYVPRREEGREAGEAGRHTFDYDGGVTGGADPPANGTYTIIAEAQDTEGQVIRRTTTLTIQDGGVPFAEIRAQPTGATVVFISQPYDEAYFTNMENAGLRIEPPTAPGDLNELPLTMRVGDLLVFRLTVTNYGQSPIRTTAGPWPGTVYQQSQNRGAMGATDESGAWRVGIQCETSSESYPWRWSIGTPDDLYTVEDPRTGNTYYYLSPGASTVVWGAIRMTELRETRNPQACWAGLIHEDVGITVVNTNVGRREVELVGAGAAP